LTGDVKNSRILVVDDDEKYLSSLRRMMHGHFDVVTTKDPIQALKILEYQGPFAVVISDFRMPVMNGIDLCSKIGIIDNNIQKILLTGYAELQMAIDAINRGKINAFLTKPIPAVSLRSVVIEAIRTYHERKNCIPREQETTPPPIAKPFMDNPASKLYAPLTVKEKEVLCLLAKGFSNAEISQELNITVGTVKTHLNNLFSKMDVTSRAKVLAKGIELGLVKAEAK
jgi:DNA-binding NarL/FixJ family response regulator